MNKNIRPVSNRLRKKMEYSSLTKSNMNSKLEIPMKKLKKENINGHAILKQLTQKYKQIFTKLLAKPDGKWE